MTVAAASARGARRSDGRASAKSCAKPGRGSLSCRSLAFAAQNRIMRLSRIGLLLLAFVPCFCREESRSPTAPTSSTAPEQTAAQHRSVRVLTPRATPIVTPAGHFVIQGTVTDASTRQPIAGADVRLIEYNFGAKLRGEQLTNGEGRFFFSTNYCDTCFLLAGHPDYYGPAQAFAGTRASVTVVEFMLSRR